MKKNIIYLAAVMLLMACNRKSENQLLEQETINDLVYADACSPINEMVKFVPPRIKNDESEDSQTGSQKNNSEKKIIKDGEISIRVQEIETAKKYLDSTINKFKAYYEQERYSNSETRLSYYLKIRVPSPQFENLLAVAEKGDGEITSKLINTRDVTADYTDIAIRLNSKKLFRERYKQLLLKTSKVPDILAIEENILNLQEEIESNEGQIKLYDDQISYSTLEINIFKLIAEEKQEVKTETFAQKLKGSLLKGWQSVIHFVLWVFQQWPIILTTLTFFFLLYRYWRKKSRK